MLIESAIEAFVKIHPLTPEAIGDLRRLFESQRVCKGDYLIRTRETAHYCYYLHNGVVRVFYSWDGNEYNKTFFTSGMFPTPLTALVSNAPCRLDFQCLTDSELIRFSYMDFCKLFKTHQCLESLMRRILELTWIKKEQHDIDMVTNDATVNYQLFRENYPGLENLIPQYHIASYLGITPIQLSRIRAKQTKG